LKEEALDRPLWKICFGRGYEPLTRLTTKSMNEYHKKKYSN